MLVPFSPPDITQAEIDEVVSALKSGWITTGPRTKEFERQLSEYCGTKKTVCLNSQTACAELALRLFEIGKGDEVIVPAYTYTASASVILHVGAKPVFIDCTKDGYEMDYDALEKAITKRTKAIIPVDMAGLPCDYDRIYQIIERKKKLFKPKGEMQKLLGRIAVMADTAHSLGAEYKGVKTGLVGDFSAFSFHAVKNLTTAEGGALTWRSFGEELDEKIYKQIQLLSLHGQSKDALAKTKLGAWEYDIIGPWYKFNMTDVSAAIGLAQLRRYPDMLKRRKEIIKKYDEAFRKIGIETLPHYTDEYTSSGHLYLTRVPNITYDERQEIIEKMAKKEIACNVHYKPLPMHTAYKKLGYDIKNYPNAYNHFVNEITIPLHNCLTDEQVDYVIENYCNIVREYL